MTPAPFSRGNLRSITALVLTPPLPPLCQVPEKAKHYGLTAKLDEPVDPAKGLVLQYEVKLSDGLTCGGAYLKFLTNTKDFDPAELTDGTPYTIMFGPDKCGSTNKV